MVYVYGGRHVATPTERGQLPRWTVHLAVASPYSAVRAAASTAINAPRGEIAVQEFIPTGWCRATERAEQDAAMMRDTAQGEPQLRGLGRVLDERDQVALAVARLWLLGGDLRTIQHGWITGRAFAGERTPSTLDALWSFGHTDKTRPV